MDDDKYQLKKEASVTGFSCFHKVFDTASQKNTKKKYYPRKLP